MSMPPATALVSYLGAADDGLNPWLRFQPAERRRLCRPRMSGTPPRSGA